MKQLKHQAELLEKIVVILVQYQDTLGVDHIPHCESCGKPSVPEFTRPHYKRHQSVQSMIEKVVDWIDNDYFPEGEPSVPIKHTIVRSNTRIGN